MMPSKLDILEDKINRLVALVEKLTVAEPVQDQWMDVDGLCSYHPDRPAKKTVYDWVTLRRVPYHKDGKRLRSIPDKKVADAYKAKNFDYVTFGGIFTVRDDAQLIFPTDLLCLDFDHVPNVQMYRNQFLADPEFETALMFTNPSGQGIKWIVPIRTCCHTYQQVFAAVTNYVKATYGLVPDQKCKDISRACFLPHDPQAYINPKYVPFNAQR